MGTLSCFSSIHTDAPNIFLLELIKVKGINIAQIIRKKYKFGLIG